METATLAGGCFWCTEGIFKEIKGVTDVTSGYCGGDMKNPDYEHVSMGNTNHAEAIQIKFDPKVVSFRDILYIFFKTHDPTSVNRQGSDVGTQYRSVIFFHNETQKKEAEKAKTNAASLYDKPVVTQIVPFKNFYKAEDYHQDYYEKNPDKAYCQLVIDPKIRKLKKELKKFTKNN